MSNSKVGRALLAVATASMMVVGCGGGGAKVEATSTNTTMGQELLDLESAYRQGIIDEKQYQTAKKDILRRYKN
jgi:hypothetical protein